ncbi:MAG: ATP-binding cassette domain-containing protein [Acidobacteria bacterium]|nr:ATP-binding cassette domain-containing protein [Acidobacteriota bacterium]
MSENRETTASDGTIVIEGLVHTYKGGHTALDGVDLSLGTGLFGLLGPNGAGKSTLMRIVCTLLVPTAGRVTVCGHDVTRDLREVRSLLGYLPQDFGAWRLHRTEEVLDTLAQLSGMLDKKHRRARVAEVLEMVGLGEVADRKVKKLSGGMVRRLGVAQALIHEPRVLVVDEPTVGLDPEERIRFRQLMSGLGRDRTILLSTHIVADVGAGCREIALLDAGKVVFQGSPPRLLELAAGKVFELTTSAEEAETAEGRYEIVSRSTTNGQVTLRGVTGTGGLPPSAQAVAEPTLEESYIAFMAARGRSGAARQDEETLAGPTATEATTTEEDD